MLVAEKNRQAYQQLTLQQVEVHIVGPNDPLYRFMENTFKQKEGEAPYYPGIEEDWKVLFGTSYPHHPPVLRKGER